MATLAIQIAIGVGGYLLQQLLAPKPKDIVGPRLADINVAAVNPGNPINRIWGKMKVPTQIIWTSELIETKHTEKVGGGKGMGGKSQKQVTYTYSVDIALGICQGPIRRIRYIRANQKILWVNPEIKNELAQDFDNAYEEEARRLMGLDVDPEEAHVSAFIFAFNYYSVDEYTLGTQAQALSYIMGHPVDGASLNSGEVNALLTQMLDALNEDAEYKKYKKRFDGLTVYTGTETQLPDPVIEGYEGVGNVPAHRGLAYFVIRNLQLEDFGNAVPSFQIEVEQASSVFLHDIIEDVCEDAGLLPNEFSTRCWLPTIPINGFAVTQNSSGRDIIGQLQQVFPFDATESSYVLRFVGVERRPMAIINKDDLGAYGLQDGERPATLQTTVRHELEMPRRLNFTYQEPERNYSTNTVHAQRFLTTSNEVEDVSVAISMVRDEARKWVDKQFTLRFMSRRSYTAVLPPKYAILDASDVVLIEDRLNPGKYKTYRVVEVNVGGNRLVEVRLTDYFFAPTFTMPEEEITQSEDDLVISGATYALMYDVPLLTDTEDDNTGFYVGLTGSRSNWEGGVLVVDVANSGKVIAFGSEADPSNSGSNWYTVASNLEYMLNGFVLNILPASSTLVRDWENHIIARFIDLNAVLYSYEEEDLLQNPYNLIFVGNELVQFAKATDLGSGMWKLEGLMRGLRGTDYWVSRHIRGERLLKIRNDGLKRVTHEDNWLNVPSTFRTYGYDSDVENVQSFTFTNTGRSKWTWSPALRHSRRIGDDLYLEWLPRARLYGEMTDNVEVGNGQPFDRYVLEVLNEMGTVIRSVELTDLRSYTYTSAMQLADFGSVQSIARINIYQIGSMYGTTGRGFPLELRL